MWQMVFTHISIEGWIIDPYVQSLFYRNVGNIIDGVISTLKSYISGIGEFFGTQHS